MKRFLSGIPLPPPALIQLTLASMPKAILSPRICTSRLRLLARLAPVVLLAAPAAFSAPSKPVLKPSAKIPPAAPRPASPKASTPKASAPNGNAKPASVPQPAPATASLAQDARGPLNPDFLAERKQAVLTSSPLTGADTLGSLFDGNVRSGPTLRPAPNGVAFAQASVTLPRNLEAVGVSFLPATQGQWSLMAATTVADLTARRGSYRLLVPPRAIPAEGYDQADLSAVGSHRVFRLEVRGTTTPVTLTEWELWTPQKIAELRLSAFSHRASREGLLPLRADGRLDGGGRLNLTDEVTWQVTPPGAGSVDGHARFTPNTPGLAQLVATHNGVRSAPLMVEVVSEGRPDWDVTRIERQPPLHYRDADAGLKIGQNVYWFGHVRNYGTSDAPPVSLEWRVDGEVVASGRLPKLERFAQTEVILTRPWDGRRHVVELVVNPAKESAETSDGNNRLSVVTDARAIGFWVEESVVRHFHQRLSVDPSVVPGGMSSWEGWAQKQVSYWNNWAALAERAGFFRGPDSRRPRWRLDRMVMMGDSMLPLSPGDPERAPDSRDDTVQWQYGFPSRTVGARGRYLDPLTTVEGKPRGIDLELMYRALSAP